MLTSELLWEHSEAPVRALRDEIREILAAAPIAEARRRRDPRPVHRALGRAGLLAPQWPVEYGGRGVSHVTAAVLVEELAMHDVPDLLHTLTVSIVGTTLLNCAGPEMRARHLPGFAAGTSFGCVLFSEPHAGSDLSVLSTRAVRHGDGYRLHGTKTHSIFARLADSALCLARDDDDALTLFLVPLAGEGVRIEPIPALMDDDFHEVTLDGVEVGPGDVVGEPGQGWAIVVRTLAYERTGLDYYVKALRWHRAATAATGRLRGGIGQHDAIGLARLNARLVAAGTLVRRVLTRLDRGELNEDEAAAAKWYTTELAAEIAWWAAERGADQAMIAEEDGVADPLDVAAREAPGMRISGGTSEMMLETLARLRLDSGAEVRP
ncbi:acyl-CoA dehydrogenase family protein [Planomonospora parontospora]|uniref:acyl-CoA dehydrogenase family protein n=1 Tax=Planomonospora parontospora TaxID=58119 RepID=UPI00166FB306|nr:acyl-CoA dehydrogenase family protein [Planomonospora parontospora]GGL14218.1 acyl-CoA dehydrogenase [Planomonospora parontospora subsp. antibiotica]GII17858.1 acyl-CoA dehydrogenase [Planomonospora parontospora subsp. antibiotica]